MAAMSAAVAVPRGLRRLFSTTIASTFMPPPPTSPGLLVERFLGSAKVLLEKSCGRHFPSLVKLSMEEQEEAEEGIPKEAQAPAPQAPPQTLGDIWKEGEASKKDEEAEEGIPKEAQAPAPQAPSQTLGDILKEGEASKQDEEAEEGIPEEAQAPAPQAPPQTLGDLLWKENEALKKDEARQGWSSYLKKAWKGVMGLWGRARGRGPPAEQAPPGGPEGGPPAEQGGYPDPPHWPDC